MAGKLARRPQSERRAATRAGLLDAAEELFAERGFAGTSLADVAEAAGVSKGAIYHHFPSKDDLFLALLEQHFAERRSAVERIAAAPGKAATERLVAEIPQDRLWNLLFLEFVVRAGRDEAFRRQLRRLLDGLREKSTAGVERFLAREKTAAELGADQLAVAIAALGNGLAIEAMTDPEADTDPLYAAALRLWLEGLRTERS
jgi:AcrR family transcriptional regulator